MKRTLLISLFLAVTLALVPLAGFAHPAEAGGCASYHVVRPGETVTIIAAHYGVNAHTLAQVNGLSNPDWVYVGMRLCIPGQAPPAQHPPSSGMTCKYHWIKRGETLSHIAKYYGVNMWTLAQRNGISNPNRIYAGQRLLISCSQPAPPKPPPPPPPPPKPPQHPPPHPGHPPAHPDRPPSHPYCDIMPVEGFGRVWYHNPKVAAKLGCPTEVEGGFHASEQMIYQGYVVVDHDGKTAYVMYNDGRWQSYPDTWHSGDKCGGHPCQAPAFGYQHPRPVTATKQPYEYGQMLWTASKGIYVLYDDGTWHHFD
jgi:LysM repeat protein